MPARCERDHHYRRQSDFNAPVDLEFEKALEKVELRIQLSAYKNETTDLMHWHVPETHYLEAWSDGRVL